MLKRILLSLWLLGTVCSCSWATTLAASDVLSRARVYLRDQATSANRQQFPDATLLQFLSDGQREANAQNWLLQSSVTVSLIQGTTEYAMPSDFMATVRLWYKASGTTAYLKLDQTSMDQLDAQAAGWTNASGVPTKYYLDRSTASIYIGFFPGPSVSGSSGTAIVYYIQQPLDITVTSQIPFNGNLILQPYASALSYYVTYRGFLAVEETELANTYLQYWINFLALMRTGTTKTPDFNPGFVGQRGP